ncbi:hypothetical protein NX774_04125 [Massilia agilis]|uniref:Lipoprotein n=1 Tax=Massilia agilis TaxID=1811226 RepID=A0ABT2D745_9BURK|nr:hypothetical protein [Massilia agilis]MCS0807104.1 hypothetical protein [Massilia agilis]
MFSIPSARKLPGVVASFPAFIPLLLLAGCGGSDQAKQQSSPPPFADSGPPDQVCVSGQPTGQAPPPYLLGAINSSEPATPPAPATLAAVSSATSDPLGEPIALADTYTGLVQGTLYNTAAWPVWWGTGKTVDTVQCLLNGNWHKHMLISIYKDGKRLGFPDGIGRVHAGCYHAYEMHVHDVTGIIHMEADAPRNYNLGNWFSLWGQPLGRDNTAGLAGPVRFYIIENGKITRYDGDPHDIAMVAHREILIVSGSTLSVVPKYQWPLGI